MGQKGCVRWLPNRASLTFGQTYDKLVSDDFHSWKYSRMIGDDDDDDDGGDDGDHDNDDADRREDTRARACDPSPPFP